MCMCVRVVVAVELITGVNLWDVHLDATVLFFSGCLSHKTGY